MHVQVCLVYEYTHVTFFFIMCQFYLFNGTACDVLSVFKRLYNKGSGNFQPPEVRPIPDSPNLQVCLVFITCHFGKMLKNGTEEFTHFSI